MPATRRCLFVSSRKGRGQRALIARWSRTIPRTSTMPSVRVRFGALALAVAGVLFVLYPAIRPYSDETSLQGAAAFASSAWIVAHVLAMLGFVLVTPALASRAM